jgi:hypothetical protein
MGEPELSVVTNVLAAIEFWVLKLVSRPSDNISLSNTDLYLKGLVFCLNRACCFANSHLRVSLDRYFRYSGFLERGERQCSTVSTDIADHLSALMSLDSIKFIYEVLCWGRGSIFLIKWAGRDLRRLSSNIVPVTTGSLCKKYRATTSSKHFVNELNTI